MSEHAEWGPWIEHDGKGCPCIGMWVQVVIATPSRKIEVVREALAMGGRPWDWTYQALVTREDDKHVYVVGAILRYRVRKPRALLNLIELVENLHAPVMPKVDA